MSVLFAPNSHVPHWSESGLSRWYSKQIQFRFRTPDTDVGPVDLWMHSLFSDVSVSLSEKLVSPPTSMYPYRAYMETILSYGPAANESQLPFCSQ
jgi:hypothetical protein